MKFVITVVVGTAFVAIVFVGIAFVEKVFVAFTTSSHVITELSIVLPKYFARFTSTCTRIQNIVFFHTYDVFFRIFTLICLFIYLFILFLI